MVIARKAERIVRDLLPPVLAGLEDALATTLSDHGPEALALIPRGLELTRIASYLACDHADSDTPLDEDALAPFAEFGRAAARRNLSVAALRLGVTTNYNVGLRIALAELSTADQTEFLPVLGWSARSAPLVEHAEVNAHLDWLREQGNPNRYRRELVHAVLTGAPAAHAKLAPAYVVSLVSPARSTPGLTAIARELSDAGLLVLPRRQFVVALVPLTTSEGRARDLARTAAVEALGGAMHVASAAGPADDLLASYREAVGVWHLLRTRAYPAGHYDVLSVLGDLLVSGSDMLAGRLRHLLAPLADSPALLDTVRHWLVNGPDRKAIAAELRVHTNTLDRRLRQIERLTGLSVTRHDDVHLLRLAVAAIPAPRR